ncbi:MAG: AbrB family transcriptional regulator [Rhizobiaceae bacterium]
MNAPDKDEPSSRLSGLTRPVQWALLLIASIVLAALFELVHLPAALLIGPLICGIAAGVGGITVRVARPFFGAAQAVLGCLIAMSISLSIFSTIADEWTLVLGVVAATVLASSFLGWLISRWKILPGTTGVWGSVPGAATAMVLMAGAFGADQRLVAFMQYLRVIMVTIAAALIARLWVDTSGVEAAPVVWFPIIDPLAFGATIGIGAAGALIGQLIRLPSPHFLGAFILGSVLHLGFSVEMQLPEWLLAISYTVIGWSIGLNFNRPILIHAARALPKIALSILTLMAFCGLLAWLIVETLAVDPLTAYLATSPGGMDSVAIIAAASDSVDISFVMALQAARFLVVLMLGPSISWAVARLVKG